MFKFHPPSLPHLKSIPTSYFYTYPTFPHVCSPQTTCSCTNEMDEKSVCSSTRSQLESRGFAMASTRSMWTQPPSPWKWSTVFTKAWRLFSWTIWYATWARCSLHWCFDTDLSRPPSQVISVDGWYESDATNPYENPIDSGKDSQSSDVYQLSSSGLLFRNPFFKTMPMRPNGPILTIEETLEESSLQSSDSSLASPRNGSFTSVFRRMRERISSKSGSSSVSSTDGYWLGDIAERARSD